VEWGDGATEELEELEMVPEGPAQPAKAQPGRARPGGMAKVAAVAVVAALVAVSLGAFFLMGPASENGKPKPPVVPTDRLSDADVLISEVNPSDSLYLQGTFVELRVGPGVSDLRDWRLTTFDNDSYVFQPWPVAGDPAYVLVNFTAGRKSGSDLSLDPRDELGLYAPDGRLADFVRWAGGGADRDPARGGWAPTDTGVYLDAGQTVSRLDGARCNATAWNASPPSPGRPNILEVTLSGARQVLWLRSGRDLSMTLGAGANQVRLAPGRPVPRAVLAEAASHLDFALRQVRRLGDPYSARNGTTGSPVLEFWVTNRSTYTGITGPDGTVGLDLGPGRHLNSFVCAREMASLVVLARWGAPAEPSLFLREGLAISEGLRSASMEISPGQPNVESLWLEMRNAGLFNPYEHGRNLTFPFIRPWDYDSHHLVNAWLFYDYNDRRFVEGGLGQSLAQSLMFAKKDPLVALAEQTGRNLTTLFNGWLDWRTAPGFRYAAPVLQNSDELGLSGASGRADLPAWTGWVARFAVNLSGGVEFNLSVGASSSGPLNFKLVASRTGTVVFNGPLHPGQHRALLAGDLRQLDEMLLLAGAAESPGSMVFQAAVLPPGPAGLNPPDGSYTQDTRPPLGWSAVAGADRYQLQMSSDPDFSSNELDAGVFGLAFTPASDLPDGTHYWRVRGWTSLGNPTAWSAAAELTIDTVAPFAYPELDEPKYRAGPADVWNVTRYTQMSFRLNASNGSPETVHYKFSDQPDWLLYGGTFQAGGADGPRSLLYYSQDAAGNLQPQQSLELFLDDSPPQINVTLGDPNYVARPGDIANVSRATDIAVSFTDAGAGVGEATYRVGGQTLPYTGPFRLSGPGGAVLVQLAAKDRLGAQSTLNLVLFLDDSPPVFSVSGLANGTLQKGVQGVSVSAADASGMSRVIFLVDAQPVAVSTGAPFGWTWDTSSVADGDHNVEVQAVDNVGNRASVFFGVKTDNTAPVTAISFEAPKYRSSGSDLWNVSSRTRFNLTATDPASGLSASWYLVGGIYHEGATFLLDNSLPDGRLDITYGSRDRSGNNETAQTISVVLDNTHPSPSISSPGTGSQLSGLVSVTVIETTSATDVAGCTFSYSVDGATWIDLWTDTNGTASWGFQWDTTKVVNGNYWIRAILADRVENSAPSVVQVIVVN
jgi:hypothetical protein